MQFWQTCTELVECVLVSGFIFYRTIFWRPSKYDATNILISAIEKVKEKSSDKIAKEIQNINEFNGALGKLSFNSKGDLEGPGFAIYEVKDGMFVPKNNSK